MQGKVEICGVNTSKLKVLKNEETMELLRRTKEGDMEAREQLIAGNLRLVLSVIQKFSNRGENLDDLFQVGCIGLIKAIDNFNTDLDVRFSTYGVPMIIGEIRRYLRDNSSVRDDGPLPEVYGNVYEGQDAMRALVREATTVICMASTLHTVATGNMTPSYRVVDGVVRPVYFYSVDVSEFAVNKLRDRGSLSVRTIVTNVQDFVVNVCKGVL